MPQSEREIEIIDWDEREIKLMKQLGFGPVTMKTKKICPNCKSLMNSQKDKCTKCGSKLPYTTVYQMYINMHNYCTKCDTVVSINAHYCPQCRNELHSRAVG